MAASAVPSERSKLPDLYSDLFILGSHLRNRGEFGNPDGLRSRIIEMFDSAERKGKELGIPSETLQQARYALAAFLDEMILNSPWPNKDQWSTRPLQYEFFREQVAGVEFFNRLDSIRRGIPPNPDLLEVYYLCLILGFEGKFKIHGVEKLKELVEGLSQDIHLRRGEDRPLSPHGGRPEELMEMVKRELPSWVVGVTCFGIVFFFYLILSFLISHNANSVAQDIQQLVEVSR